MSSRQQARLLMEALAVLHQRGYGRLKLFCYIKGGLGAWRHWLFASDEFPNNVVAWQGPKHGGSLPGWAIFSGTTAQEVADDILSRYPHLAQAARGKDEVYVSWYQQMLADYPDGILEMESPYRASISDFGDITVPALKAWTKPPPTPEELAAQRELAQHKVIEDARRRHRARQQRKK